MGRDEIRSASLHSFHEDHIEPPDAGRFEELVHEMLTLLGEHPERDGLKRTPARVASSLQWLTRGYQMSVEDVIGDAVFEEKHENMILVRDIEIYSLCEHHLLPFTGEAHVAYLPNGRVIGLSKIPRIVEMYARRLQIQERLTREIADAMEEVLAPDGVGVVLVADHACMSMRGVEQPATRTVTRCLRGALRTDPTARAELLSLLRYS